MMPEAKEAAPAAEKGKPTTPSTLVSARVFECYSPPPANTFSGAMVPRVFNKHRRRRKVAIEIHRVGGGAGGTEMLEECIVRVLDPESESERQAAKQRAKEKHHHVADDESVSSATSAIPPEYRDMGTHPFDKGWVPKYKFPVQALSIKGTHKTGVFVHIDLGKTKQVRELIFDSVGDAEAFQSVVRMELQKESIRAEAKVAAAIGNDKTMNADDKITFLIEIVSAWDIPIGDLHSSDPFVECSLNRRKIHRTKYIPKTLDPIWTLKTHSLFLLDTSVSELFGSNGLECILYDFDKFGKNETLGMVIVPPRVLYDAKGERMKFKLQPKPGKKEAVPGWLAIRCRRASEYDIDFMNEYYSDKGHGSLGFLKGKARAVALQDVAETKGGSGNIKSLITRKTRTVKDIGKQYKVRPFPDPSRTEQTSWLTKKEIDAESLSPSQNWVDSGSGSLGRVHLEILGCDGLPNLDTGGFAGNKTDAFVSIVYGDTCVRTDVIDDCLSPRWMPWCQRAFILHLLHPSCQLFLGVFDYDEGINPTDDHDLIGRVSIDLSNLQKNTVYTLKYHIYPTARMSKRKARGTITVRLRIETNDERRLLLSNLEPPPAIYVNAKTRRDFRMIRYTVTGLYDMDKYNMNTINEYLGELLALKHSTFYIQDGIFALLLWRNNFDITLGSRDPIYLPLHSLMAFITAIFLVEYPQFIPSFCFASIGWLMVGINGYRRGLPDLWSRCKGIAELVEALVLGSSLTPPAKIKEGENRTEASEFLMAWEQRIEDAEKAAEKAYLESLKQQEEYQKEMEEFDEEEEDISTRKDGLSVDPFKPILFPLQQQLALFCRYVRHVKHIVSWEECYLAFWVTVGSFLLATVCLFVPWFFLIQWTSRVVVWTVFGPWMKLVDIFYFQKVKPLTEEEEAKKAEEQQRRRKLDMSNIVSAKREKKENSEKLKAMKKYLFGKFILRVPVLKEDRYRDLPLIESSATPYKPAPRALAELAMEDAGYHRTRIPGQHLEGDMIPKVVSHNFTDAPIGQATAHPSQQKDSVLRTSPESTAAAYATIASVVVAAGVLTYVGVPLLSTATEYILTTSSA